MEDSESEKIIPHAPSKVGYRHFQIFLVFLMITICYAMRTNLSTGIVAMTDRKTNDNPNTPVYDWGDKSIVLSSFYWGYVLLQPLAGHFGKTWGVKWFVLVAMLANSLACMLTPLIAASLGSKGVMGLRATQGLFQGFFYPSAHNLLSAWAPKPERSRLTTFVYGGASMGTIIGMTVTGLIATSWSGWPLSFYIFGGVGLTWSAAWLFFGANTPAECKIISKAEVDYIEATLGHNEHQEIGPLPLKQIFTSMPVWALIIATFGQTWGYSTLLTEISNFINKVMKLGMLQNALWSSAPYLTLFLLTFVVGPISDYIVNNKIVTVATSRKIFNTIGVCSPALALSILSFVPEEDVAISITLLIIAGGLNAGTFAGQQVNHMDLAPNYAGFLMGVTNGSSNIFSIISPLFVQAVVTDESNKSQWRIVFLVAAGIYTFSAIFYIIFGKGELLWWNDPKNFKKTKNEPKISSISIKLK